MPTRHDVIMTSPALIFPADSFAAGKPGSRHRPDFEHQGNPLHTAGATESPRDPGLLRLAGSFLERREERLEVVRKRRREVQVVAALIRERDRLRVQE